MTRTHPFFDTIYVVSFKPFIFQLLQVDQSVLFAAWAKYPHTRQWRCSTWFNVCHEILLTWSQLRNVYHEMSTVTKQTVRMRCLFLLPLGLLNGVWWDYYPPKPTSKPPQTMRKFHLTPVSLNMIFEDSVSLNSPFITNHTNHIL